MTGAHCRSFRHLAVVLLSLPALAVGQSIGGQWQALGPGPALNGQIENVPGQETVGAVNALAPHPSDPDILYAGAVNGGIWRTGNATAIAPTWVQQTDQLATLSIGAIEFDPTDPSLQTLVAGVARNSSLGQGGQLLGILRTSDGGASWSVLTALGTNRSVVGVVGRGDILLAATNGGVFRSTDAGLSFVQVAGTSGLAAGDAAALAGDPGNPQRLYALVISGADPGVYRSDDTGATWGKVSDSSIDSLLGSNARAGELSIGSSGQVYAAIVQNLGELTGVFRSADGNAPWLPLEVPLTIEDGFPIGIHPGGQARLHLSLVADPVDPQVVYVGGDRQPGFGERSGSGVFFPNSIGANDFSGRLFRGNASLPPATRWPPLTHVGTANNSSPHADSRDMAFDAQGNLLEASDGGVYKRTLPRSASGVWLSINGSLQTTEYQGIAWDSVSDRVIGGAQDNGTTEQILADSAIFDTVGLGDGGDPAVEDRSSATESTRYTSFQFLGAFTRRSVDADNQVTSIAFPALQPLNGSPAPVGQFYTPLATHYTDGMRLLIGASNGLFESFDRGDTVVRVSPCSVSGAGDSLVYGVAADPEWLLCGDGESIYRRNSASGGNVDLLFTFPDFLRDVDVNRLQAQHLYAVTNQAVYHSNDGGQSFNEITGNLLTTYSPGALRTLAHVGGESDALVVGAERGIYVAFGVEQYAQWYRLGSGLPNALIHELEYDEADQLLVAATVGRGAWALPVASLWSDALFGDGFE